MKKLIIFVLFVAAYQLNGQFKITSVSPSIYYTSGNYSNFNSSSSVSIYSTLQINTFDFLTLGLDNLVISSKEWEYDQNMFVAGFINNLFPFFIKANYAHINGDYNYLPQQYSYTDKINILNFGLAFNYDLFYFGGDYSYMDLIGFKSTVSRNYELLFSWVASPDYQITLLPTHTNLGDGRKLYSATLSLSGKPFNKTHFQIDGTLGARAYYFNSSSLTMFNQDETQTKAILARIEFDASENFKLSVQYLYASFSPAPFSFTSVSSYSIQYLTAGVKIKFASN